MPLQNRVTPFGDIIAVADRGLFTGNRGIIHDPVTRTIRRRWAGKSWLVCLCEFKGRKRQLMSPGRWTELFFLDEATALAAGHRPCFECRRAAAKAFQAAWARGNGGNSPLAKTMDAILHAERLSGRAKRLHPVDYPLSEMPDGAMVARGQDSFLVVGGGVLRWTPAGYAAAGEAPGCTALLTPLSTLRALQAGYRPCLHPSALTSLQGLLVRPPGSP
jgi:hypothetical protein